LKAWGSLGAQLLHTNLKPSIENLNVYTNSISNFFPSGKDKGTLEVLTYRKEI